MMTFQRLGIGVSLMFLVAAVFAAGPLIDQVPVKPKQALKVQFRPPTDLMVCVNCARLDVRIFSLPGDGCIPCEGLSVNLGLFAFFDPDIYIENHGNLASNPGTVAFEWYDLVLKTTKTMSVAIPAVPPGGWEPVGLPCTYMVFLKTDGIKMTIDYSDANGARHRVRTVRKCPDN
jgi:hypothetical protein